MGNYMTSYLLRSVWAVFAGAIFVIGFSDSWKAETGKKKSFWRSRSDIVLWEDPLLFPCLLVLLITLSLFTNMAEDNTGIRLFMQNFFLDVFLFISVYFSVILILLPILRKHYTAKTCAAVWLVPAVVFYFPSVYLDQPVPPAAVLYIPDAAIIPAAVIWGTGFVLVLAVQIISHNRFAVRLKNTSKDIKDDALLELWRKLKNEMELPDSVQLKYTCELNSPLSIGMKMKNMITYLPERNYTKEEAELIFMHELHHIERRDTHMKFLMRFCSAIGWFHPLVWMAVKKAEEDMELSCDEIVLVSADDRRRKEYVRLILGTTANVSGFSTCLSGTAESLRYRLAMILQKKKKSLGKGILFLCVLLGSFSIGHITFTTEKSTMSQILQPCFKNVTSVDIYLPEEKSSIKIQDMEELMQYLSNREVKKMDVRYDNMLANDIVTLSAENEEDISFRIADRFVYFYDQENKPEIYYLTSPIDWERIMKFQ